jgi:P-loop Domain of unknown function (DUF2791)
VDPLNPLDPVESQKIHHSQFGPGTLLKTFMGGFEWEVQFDSGRRFRLPAREFDESPHTTVASARPLPARMAVMDGDRFRAQQTLEALRVGVVPVRDAETLTIGLEAEQVTLDRALARSRERSGDALAVIGDYGFGKSHFIELAARRGLRENFIVADASLDLVEVPPGKAHKIYEALVTSLRYPDTDRRGLLPLLDKALENPSVIARFAEACPREPKNCPLASALLALQDCSSQLAFDEIVQWLSGQAKPQAEMRGCLKKPPPLYVTRETARQYSYLLTGISTLATMLGYSGLAVLIDESEHYSLLRATQRERADSFFKAMIVSALGLNNGRIDARTIPDNSRAEYPVSYASEPHLLFLFALTESADRMPVGSWLAPSQIVRLDDRFIEKDIREFFGTLLGYHALAYDYEQSLNSSTPERYSEVTLSTPGMLSRALSQHRINVRQLIRTAVTVCDLLYLHPSYQASELLEELKRGLKV